MTIDNDAILGAIYDVGGEGSGTGGTG